MNRSSNELFANWHGIIDNDFVKTISQTFKLPDDDAFVYRAEAFAMTMAQIQDQVESGKLKYQYQSHGNQIEVPSSDIKAYTSIFSSSTDSLKALNTFFSNAKKSSPRETVAKYLQSRRVSPPFKISKSKNHINPYLDFWEHSCQLTSFLGPLPDSSYYADPLNARITHPILPVFYHHFGCVVPTHEALSILSQYVSASGAQGVIDMGSGNGYWTYMLRQLKLDVIAVDNMASEYRTIWISDTVKADGVDFLKRNTGVPNRLLLMVYPIVSGTFTQRVIQTYRGDTIAIVGTQNANRYTGFRDITVEDWFEKFGGWELTCSIAMPSFAGKDEGMFIWERKK